MPSVEWMHNGIYTRCDSSDPIVISRWLLEQIRKAGPGNPGDLIQVKIYPIYRDNSADWPRHNIHQTLESLQEMDRLAAYIIAWEVERSQPIPPPVTDDTESKAP